jgi:LuxR family transcriptional regulator, maltose regulon positive regulatory protein
MDAALVPERLRALVRLSLAPQDHDPVRLWRGVIAAVRAATGRPGFGRDAEAMLAAGPEALDGAVLPLLAAELALAEPVVALAFEGAVPSAAARETLARMAELGARVEWAAASAEVAPTAPVPPVLPTADVVAASWEAALRRGERATVLAWLDALGDDPDPRLWLVARWAALERGQDVTARLADPSVPPAERARGHLLHAADALRRGDLAALARRIERAAPDDPREGYWHAFEALLRAQEAFWRGHPRVAHRHFARAAGLAAIHGDRFALTAATGALAILAAEAGDDDGARRRLDRLEDLRDADPAVGEHPVAFAGALAEGRLLELAGACESAAAPLRRAIVLAERGGAVLARAEGRLRLASVHRACRRPDDAAPLEAEALALLGGAGAGLDRGRLAGLAAAAAPASGSSADSALLTPGERAILRLLPSGLSQREIGARLHLSVNTVKTHSRNIYMKLHAGSREEAVARAHERGLL